MLLVICILFFFNDTATTEIYTLSLHDALPIWDADELTAGGPVALLLPDAEDQVGPVAHRDVLALPGDVRSEEHTSELQSRLHLVCRLLLEKKKPTLSYQSSTLDVHTYHRNF